MQYTVRAFVGGRDERLLEGPSMASGKGLMATTLDAQSGSSIRLIHTRRLWCSCGAGRISYTSQPYRTAWLGSAIGRDARRRILLIDSVGRKGPTPRGGGTPVQSYRGSSRRGFRTFLSYQARRAFDIYAPPHLVQTLLRRQSPRVLRRPGSARS